MSDTADADAENQVIKKKKAFILKRAGHKILKQTAFGRAIEQNLKLTWGGRVQGVKIKKGVAQSPTMYYDNLRGEGVTLKNQRHVGKAEAVGRTVAARIVLGPELNIVLLGIPLLLLSARSMAIQNKPKKPPQAARFKDREVVEVKIKLRRHSSAQIPPPAPLASSPYSDEFMDIVRRLVEHGMDEDVAVRVVNDEFDGMDLADALDGDDLDAMLLFMEEEIE